MPDGLRTECVDRRTRQRRAALRVDRPHDAARTTCRAKHAKPAFAREVRHIDDRKRKARVRLVGAVAVHRLLPGDAREGVAQVAAHHVPEHPRQQPFQQRQHVRLRHERHFQVDLRKLRLAVGAQVLVAEAARDLVVPVDAADHQQLLENLGRLWQRVERPGPRAAGHEVVAGSLGRRFGQHRRFDGQEALRRQVRLGGLLYGVPEFQRRLHARPAQVQVAVGQAQRLAHSRVLVQRKRQRLGVREQRQAACV